MAKRQAKWEIYPDADGQRRWRLKAANGETVAQGEAHASVSKVLRAIVAVLKAAITAKVVLVDR